MNARWIAAGLLFALLVACGAESPPADVPAPAPADDGTPTGFLDAEKGKVVVLLLGMQGCPGTRDATRVLADLEVPADVAIARVDVPPPGGRAEPYRNWPHSYRYLMDEDRALAKKLEFFFYPTLYVLDREGEARYSGSCEAGKLAAMVEEIRTERPGGKKKVYTVPPLAVGAAAPAKRDAGPTLVFFTSVGCPFSTKALGALPDVELDFEEHDVGYVIVERTAEGPATAKVYDDLELPGDVVNDADGAIAKAYGVDPVPFFFVIDAAGAVAARGPYTEGGVRQALAKALGIEVPGGAKEATGAG